MQGFNGIYQLLLSKEIHTCRCCGMPYIQSDVLNGRFELVWSYILEYENSENPYHDRKDAIQRWRSAAKIDCDANDEIVDLAGRIEKIGVKPKDALHIACALSQPMLKY